jgi:cell division protein FtsB
MVLGKEISRKGRQVIVPLIGAMVMAYFGYHAVQGDRGLIAWWNLRYEIEKTDYELAEVTTEKQVLEHRVSLLRPASLDRDMLEERARLMLGSVGADDLIVPLTLPPQLSVQAPQ